MKKIVIVILSAMFLSSSTELHELFRLPLLLEHYLQHRSKDSDLSLVDFLKIHYSENHPNDQDDDDDNQLPFKSKGGVIHIDTPVSSHPEVDEKQNFPPAKKLIISNAEGVPVKKSYSIFRPPRLV